MPTSAELPALLGGNPVRPQGPPDWPPPDEDVLHALQAAYRDGSYGKYQGGHVEKLERCLAEFHGVEHVLTCSSGTCAVELALRALQVGPGDEVLLAAYDYSGNFLTIHALGARPVLVDVDPRDWNLSIPRIEEAIGPQTRALIVSHLHGGLVPMTEIMALAATHHLRVVEDAAQCPGARIEGRRAGTGGDIGVLSFGGSKLLSAGRGGAIMTRHGDIHQRVRLAQNRGNLVSPLSELQAAVVLPQLEKLDARNKHRATRVQGLVESLRDIPGFRPFAPRRPDGEPAYYKLGFQFDANAFGLSRKRFVAALRAEGIAFDDGFRALHVGRSPARYRRGGCLDETERAHMGCIVLHHPVLLGSIEDVEEVARAVRKVYANGDLLSE